MCIEPFVQWAKHSSVVAFSLIQQLFTHVNFLRNLAAAVEVFAQQFTDIPGES